MLRLLPERRCASARERSQVVTFPSLGFVSPAQATTIRDEDLAVDTAGERVAGQFDRGRAVLVGQTGGKTRSIPDS